MQEKGIHYWETYAPVMQWMSVRLTLTLAAIVNLHTKSIYFVLAYPQADLDVDIYMELPQGVNVGPERGIYFSLERLSSTFGKLSINPSKVDPCVFIREDIIVLVYVDNCLIISQDKDKINQLINKLKKK